MSGQQQPQRTKTRRHIDGHFLKGPISLEWLSRAAKAMPKCGKALHVALAIHYLNGFKQTGTVALTSATLREFGISRQSMYTALDELEVAKLIKADRHKGRSPRVTIIAD